MRLESLSATNFRSWAGLEVRFGAGEVHHAVVSGANGAGKSSIIEALLWGLYGKSRSRGADGIVRCGETNCLVEVCFQVGQSRYFVRRKRSSQGRGRSELELYLVEEVAVARDGLRSISKKGARETQVLIDDVVGVGYEELVASSVILQGGAGNFTGARPEARREILRSLLQLGRWRDWATEARRLCRDRVAKADTAEAVALRCLVLRRVNTLPPPPPEWQEACPASISDALDLAVNGAGADVAGEGGRLEMAREARETAGLVDLFAQLDQATEDLAEVTQAAPPVENDRASAIFECASLAPRLCEAIGRLSGATASIQEARSMWSRVMGTCRLSGRVDGLPIATLKAVLRQRASLALREAELECLRQAAEARDALRHDLVDLEARRQTARELCTLEGRRLNQVEEGARTAERLLERVRSQAARLEEAPCTAAEGWQALDALEEHRVGRVCMLSDECPLLADARAADPVAARRAGVEARRAVTTQQEALQTAESELDRLHFAFFDVEGRLAEATEAEARAGALGREISNDRAEHEALEGALDDLAKAMAEAASHRELISGCATLGGLEPYAAGRMWGDAARPSDLWGHRGECPGYLSQSPSGRGCDCFDVVDRAVVGAVETAEAGGMCGGDSLVMAFARTKRPCDRAKDLLRLEASVSMDLVEAKHAKRALLEAQAAESRAEGLREGAEGRRERAAAAVAGLAEAIDGRDRPSPWRGPLRRGVLEGLDGAVHECARRLGAAEAHLETVASNRDAAKAQLEDRDRLRDEAAVWQDVASVAALAPVLVIEQHIAALEAAANKVLDVCGGGTRVRLDTVRATQAGGQAETLDLAVITSEGERAYEDLSGGERVRVDIAIRLALAGLLSGRDGTPPDFLIIDEGGFGALDPEGQEALGEAIGALVPSRALILLVTHLPGMAEALPQRVEVRPGPGGATLVVL